MADSLLLNAYDSKPEIKRKVEIDDLIDRNNKRKAVAENNEYSKPRDDNHGTMATMILTALKKEFTLNKAMNSKTSTIMSTIS